MCTVVGVLGATIVVDVGGTVVVVDVDVDVDGKVLVLVDVLVDRCARRGRR